MTCHSVLWGMGSLGFFEIRVPVCVLVQITMLFKLNDLTIFDLSIVSFKYLSMFKFFLFQKYKFFQEALFKS